MIGRGALVLATLAAPALGARDQPLAGRVAGTPAECIDIDRVQGPEIVDNRTILYRQSAQRVWRTGPDGACSPMRSGDGVDVVIAGRRLCQGDRFRVRYSGYYRTAASCRFSAFVPYDR